MKRILNVIPAIALICLTLPATAQPGRKIGGDRDEHGCLPAAGYQWSTLQQECIRVFETGVQFVEVKPRGSATFSAMALVSDDKRKAEVFLPDRKGSVMLRRMPSRNGYMIWQSGNVRLTYRYVYRIELNGRLAFNEKPGKR